jgi:hypothetical protein
VDSRSVLLDQFDPSHVEYTRTQSDELQFTQEPIELDDASACCASQFLLRVFSPCKNTGRALCDSIHCICFSIDSSGGVLSQNFRFAIWREPRPSLPWWMPQTGSAMWGFNAFSVYSSRAGR